MWYFLIGYLILIYLLIHFVIQNIFSGFIGSYIIQPVLWVSLIIFTIFLARKQGLNIWVFKKIRPWKIGRSPSDAAILIGGFHLSLLIIAGLYFGFGKSPYEHHPAALITNSIYFLTILFGMELSRSYLLKKTVKRNNITAVLLFITVLYLFIQLSPSQLTLLSFQVPKTALTFIGETIIPLLALSLFASYLAYIGGALPAICYLGVINGFTWFSPVLPNLEWSISALIGTIGPAIGFLIIQTGIQETQPGSKRGRKKVKDPSLSWTVIAIISLLVIFFSFGYFGVQPTVIYSGSMQPAIEIGDIVIISETPHTQLQKGDIIQYYKENESIPIVHRIHEKITIQNQTYFITKGDANNQVDAKPVFNHQITGKTIFTLPKIGWIAIYIKQLIRPISTL